MQTLRWFFLLATVLHIVEEYVFPGGFPAAMRRQVPRFAHVITTPFAVVINGLQVILCLVVIANRSQALLLPLSLASLLLFNGLTHTLGTIRSRRYVPGTITGLLVYLPLALVAFLTAAPAPALARAALLLGLLFQAVPVIVIGLLGMLQPIGER